ncbi:MAG: biotin--[Bacteroidaceae bacterium]|nr:biotin--[acetyl-CoA-carboxylase] ligase [Bacteroidaceae bacterium]
MLDAGETLPELTLVDADEQTSGRGQRGNSWESEKGRNVQFSLVCHPHFLLASQQFALSEAIALAVAETVGGEVKWPNDIYVGDRKISGTLIECDLSGKQIETCIIGTGINVNQTQFRSDAPNPVSLSQLTGREYDREEVLRAVVDRFAGLYDLLRKGGAATLHRMYLQHLYRRQGLHRYADRDGEFLAEVHAVEPSGHLLLRRPDGHVSRYEFKEVKFLNT